MIAISLVAIFVAIPALIFGWVSDTNWLLFVSMGFSVTAGLLLLKSVLNDRNLRPAESTAGSAASTGSTAAPGPVTPSAIELADEDEGVETATGWEAEGEEEEEDKELEPATSLLRPVSAAPKPKLTPVAAKPAARAKAKAKATTRASTSKPKAKGSTKPTGKPAAKPAVRPKTAAKPAAKPKAKVAKKLAAKPKAKR